MTTLTTITSTARLHRASISTGKDCFGNPAFLCRSDHDGIETVFGTLGAAIRVAEIVDEIALSRAVRGAA
jgi:hypothetical protein